MAYIKINDLNELNNFDFSSSTDVLDLYGNDSNLITIIEKAFEEDIYCIINNDGISTLFQAIKAKGELIESGDLAKKIKELSETIEAPNMSKYEEEINSLSDMDEEKFNEFMEDIKKLKVRNGIIDEKYCNYIIKQKILSNHFSEKGENKYFNVFKRVIEDKVRYILKENDIEDYYVYMNPFLDEKTLGSADIKRGCIDLKEEELKKLSIENTEMLDIMFHECRHVVQEKHIQENDMDYNEYLMLKESFIENEDIEFYDRNYIFMYKEIDARIAGAKGAYKYLSDLGLDNMKIVSKDSKTFLECYEEKLNLEKEVYASADLKENSKEEYEFVETMFYRELLTWTEIDRKKLFSQYPVFNLEYNKNGLRKKKYDILKEYEEEIKLHGEDSKRAKLIVDIFKDNAKFRSRLDKFDINSYIADSDIDERLKKLRDYDIENMMEQYINEEEKISYRRNETEEDKKANFDEMVRKLNQFANLHPDEEISKKIKEKIEPYKSRIPEEDLEVFVETNREDIAQDGGEKVSENVENLSETKNETPYEENGEDTKSMIDCINVTAAKDSAITRNSISQDIRKIKEALRRFRSSKTKKQINIETTTKENERGE